jgi:hypothetical protein
MDSLTQSDIFKFVSLRPATLKDTKNEDLKYIKDEYLKIEGTWRQKAPRDLMTESNIGNQVLTKVEQGIDVPTIVSDITSYFSFAPEELNNPPLQNAVDSIKKHIVNFDKTRLVNELTDALGSDLKLYVIHGESTDKTPFEGSLGQLFDQLYALYILKRKNEINLEFVINGLKALHVIETLVLHPNLITLRKQLASVFDAVPIINPVFAFLRNTPFNNIKPIGIGDLKVVKQWIKQYQAGEVAHIENVLKGETKDRIHRRLDRREDIFSVEAEKTEETERETQTTDRFELKQEADSTVQQDMSLELGTSVSGKYGMIEYAANGSFAFSQSSTEARRNAANFAKEVVDRSLTKIQKRVKEERINKNLHEVEETNTHGLSNKEGDKHVSGIYHWVDKHYKAQVFNYGKRMMFEFIIPEPAAFYKYAEEHNRKVETAGTPPVKPAFPGLSISQIDNAIVDTYSVKYNLPDLEPMPAEEIIRTTVLHLADIKDTATKEIFIEIPENYIAKTATISGAIVNAHVKSSPGVIDFYHNSLFIGIGGSGVQVNNDTEKFVPINKTVLTITDVSNKANFTVLSDGVKSYTVNIEVKCVLTSSAKRKWQMKTYTDIMDAYNKLLAIYKSELADYQDKAERAGEGMGVQITGKNPLINAEIIKSELKKHCITLIAKEFDTDAEFDTNFDAMKDSTNPPDFPKIDIEDSKSEGKLIQFLEQAFEWTQISYLLFPYFWGKKANWEKAQLFWDDEDPMFGKFLQAGAARVLLPVRSAYEIAVLHFLYTREPWNGGPAPGLYDSMYLPIHEELRNQQDDLNGAAPEGTPWDVIVPTSLVYLKDSTSELPIYI